MRHAIHNLLTFLRDECGPTAVEYAVMLALIVVVCLASITVLGRTSRRDFRVVGRSLTAGS
jgi:pilus assembly protein Flp/PilA